MLCDVIIGGSVIHTDIIENLQRTIVTYAPVGNSVYLAHK